MKKLTKNQQQECKRIAQSVVSDIEDSLCSYLQDCQSVSNQDDYDFFVLLEKEIRKQVKNKL